MKESKKAPACEASEAGAKFLAKYSILSTNYCLPRTILLKRVPECSSNFPRAANLDVAALHHVDQLAVAQQSDRGRRGRIPGKMTSHSFSGLTVLSGKDCDHVIRTYALLNSGANARTHL